jgi:heme/copper-type cytochrome/quinol oxidase subunit 2
LSLFFDAPLLERANISNPPNPAKSAWFLLWIQELVSYSIYNIYIVIFLFVFYLMLPFIRGKGKVPLAKWFPEDDRITTFVSIFIFLGIIILTIIAYFFRGPDWHINF